MTIREEITNIIGDFIIDKSLTAEQRADKILKLFEKLIDKTINKCKSENFAESDEAIGILEDLKEELVK